MSRITIVIPNYNGERLLEKCINSILNQTGIEPEIIVVDNGSDTIDYAKNKFSEIIFKEFNKNKGFSAAVNYGIKSAKGDYIAILNNDTELSPSWAENIIKVLEQNPDVMLITSKIFNFNNKSQFDDVGDVILSSGKVYKLGNSEKDSGQYDQPHNVFGASGCASVYRKEFFDKVGYFDEDFFAYLEDIDLSFRANLMGLKCLYVPDAVVYHVGSATTGSRYNKFTVFHHAQNTINVIIKNYPAKLILRYLPNILYYIGAMQAFFLLKGLGWAYLKGILSGVKMVRRMLPKRKDIMKKRVISDSDLVQIFKENKRMYTESRKNRVGC